VGSYGANPFGLFDLHGNVWEWCDDWYGEYDVSGLQDPTGPSSGSSRVLRGGSWSFCAVCCRSANRFNFDPSCRYNDIGLRVVSELV
jgi:formylglycine-generating enzyme required for sulfatase activity